MNVKGKVFLFLSMLFIVLFPLGAYADMGPKPSLTIIVSNPPEGVYYLDLLVRHSLFATDNLEGRRDTLDREKLKLLEEYSRDGWYAALAKGTGKPLWGGLTGEYKDGVATHTFGYFGLPNSYKIIIITPENEIKTTREITKKAYVSTVYYDYATGIVEEGDELSLSWVYAKQFLMTLIPTLILEGVVLLLFRFKSAGTLGIFFIVNIITQALLSVVMSTSLLKLGIYASYVVLLPVVLLIIGAEVAAFVLLFKEGSRKKRAAFAICANLVSAAALLPLMYLEYMLFIA